MKELSVARVYASAVLDLCNANNIDAASELTKLTEVINSSNDLENLLFLDVFSAEEKVQVFETIAKKLQLSEIIINSIKYLLHEKRIGLLPLVYKEVIVHDDHKKGFIRGEVHGSADSLVDNDKKQLLEKISNFVGQKNIILDYKKTNSVTAGYKVIVDDLQLDATVDYQLEKFKESIISE